MEQIMAGAPFKTGLDYFSLDVDIEQDDKIQLIEAKYPEKGFEIIIKLLCKIYKEGYYYRWTEKEQLLFARKINTVNINSIDVNINYVSEVINDSINWGLFNQELYLMYTLLTSSGIQKRYFQACKRRQSVQLIKQLTLIDINEYNNLIIVDINSINDVISKQSKVKESKVKESKGKENVNVLFSEFWNLYPKRNGRKVGKVECSNWWNKNVKSEEIALQIMSAVKIFANCDKVKKGYAEDPIRFLRHKRFQDYDSEISSLSESDWDEIFRGDKNGQ